MRHTEELNGSRANLKRVVWLPFSLVWGAIALAGLSALEFVFSHKQKLKRERGLLWGVLSISYWILAAVFTGEWRLGKQEVNSAKA